MSAQPAGPDWSDDWGADVAPATSAATANTPTATPDREANLIAAGSYRGSRVTGGAPGVTYGYVTTWQLTAAIGAAIIAVAPQRFVPAEFRSGTLPNMPDVQVVGGGQVLLAVLVDRDGRVGIIDVVRSTPPFTKLMTAAVRS